MIQDLHIHSNYSDGADPLRAMVEEAIRLGIDEIGFTDHVRRSSDWTGAYRKEIASLQEEFEDNIRIFAGVETKLLDFDGDLDIPNALYTEDVRIVAAIHRIPTGDGHFIRKDEIPNDVEKSKAMWLRSFAAFALNSRIDCIAHPFSLLAAMGIGKEDTAWWQKVAAILDRTTCKIEYNVKYDHSIVPEWLWDKHLGKIVVGSDSHSVADLKMRYAEILWANCKYIK